MKEVVLGPRMVVADIFYAVNVGTILVQNKVSSTHLKNKDYLSKILDRK